MPTKSDAALIGYDDVTLRTVLCYFDLHLPFIISDNYQEFHFVLVHGAGHGAWCWFKVVSLLQNAGHNVTAIDLAGAGLTPVDPNTILSFHDYNRPLIHFLSDLPHAHKVVLVGHSAGGLSLTHAMSVMGHKIAVAVYVGATMLSKGFCSKEDVEQGVPNLWEEYELKYGLGPNHPPTTAKIRKEFQRDLLYQLSPPENARFDGEEEEELLKNVNRVYIKTLQDRIVLVEKQEAMIRRWPPDEVLCIDSDHSPFFSSPAHLHRLLLHIAAKYSS
eukprot:Gb_09897 [translate_table: standard]